MNKILQWLRIMPKGKNHSPYLQHERKDGVNIVCISDKFNTYNLKLWYQFDWYNESGLMESKRQIYPCSQAPEGAKQVRVIIWGEKFGRIIMLLRWYRRVTIIDEI